MKAQRKPTTPTKAEALLDVCQFSRFGSMAQLFVFDAICKNSPEPTRCDGEDNVTLFARLLKSDADKGRTITLDAVTRLANAVAGAGLEGTRAAFEKAGHGLVHPDSWHGVAVEIRDTLNAAL